jgi:hypothetical protein
MKVTFDVKQRLQVVLVKEKSAGKPGKPEKTGKSGRIITDSPYK